MYNIYLWKVKPTSSHMTLWQSDTIYGHMLYAIAMLYGREEYDKIVNDFIELKSPFIVSDGFIGEKLPLFNKNGVSRKDTEFFSKEIDKDLVETVKALKKINKIKNISVEEFNKLRTSKYSNRDFILEKLKNSNVKEKKEKTIQNIALVLHNNINRCTGTTIEDGIFSLKEYFINDDIYVFIKVRKDFSIGKLDEILKFIEVNGFGKKVSSGKGAIERVVLEKYEKFQDIKGANAFISLSNYTPKEGDYTDVICATPLVKRGKTADVGDNMNFPFKKPFSCFTAGALFKGSVNNEKGKVLTNIYINKNVVQIGIPFVLGVEV